MDKYREIIPNTLWKNNLTGEEFGVITLLHNWYDCRDYSNNPFNEFPFVAFIESDKQIPNTHNLVVYRFDLCKATGSSLLTLGICFKDEKDEDDLWTVTWLIAPPSPSIIDHIHIKAIPAYKWLKEYTPIIPNHDEF
jgi:hypothetical protein